MFTQTRAKNASAGAGLRTRKLFSTLALVGVVSLGSVALVGCGSEMTRAADEAASAGIPSVDGRGVRVTDDTIVLRTAEGERTFVIKPEDMTAVGPEHIESHLGIDSIGFKVYYVSENGVDYAVSVEEVNGSALGFD